jgi:hypothetical protein
VERDLHDVLSETRIPSSESAELDGDVYLVRDKSGMDGPKTPSFGACGDLRSDLSTNWPFSIRVAVHSKSDAWY